MARRGWVAGWALLLGFLSQPAAAQVRTQLVVSGLSNPVAYVMDPLDHSTFYVVEQRGTIRTVRNNELLPAFFLDIRSAISSGGERGLLGLAFAPDHAASRRLYVNFTNPDGDTVVARYTRTASGSVDANSRFDLMWPGGRRYIEQPFSNHNGGHLAFGPDTYLYIGLGDGGSGGDPQNNAQNPNTLLGKMLRIDVNVPTTTRAAIAFPRTIRSSIGNRFRRSARSGRSACAIPGATPSTTGRMAAPRPW